MPKRFLLKVAVIFAMIAIPIQALAYTVFTAELKGSNAIPPNFTQASGKATLILNDAQTEVFYIIEISHPSGGRELGSMIQNAGPGANGPIFHMLPLGLLKDGTWMVTPFQVNELLNGRVYIAYYTLHFPGGEIRGNCGEPPSPTEDTSWGSVKALY